jgi:oligopeptide/dipeptide ABC transporter ATP-binding protein
MTTDSPDPRRPVFEVDGLEVRFRTGEGVARAVNGISFSVHPGERVAVVGESGCGKSASLLAALRLLPSPPAQVAGRVLLDGTDLFALNARELNDVLGRDVAMVFQDSLSSLNPVLRMGRQITEGVRRHEGLSKKDARAYATELLTRVGVPDPAQRVDQYPHQLSGGMRQRAMIAMALAGKPKLLIADEPTTALDVTVQAQILDLVRGLEDVAIVWVSHDLGVVAGLADRVLVMYAGYIIEEGDVRSVFHRPRHPYTRGLLNSVPSFRDADRSRLAAIPGLPPTLTDLPAGCPFYDRCELREPRCSAQMPPLTTVDGTQRAACWVTAAPLEVAS